MKPIKVTWNEPFESPPQYGLTCEVTLGPVQDAGKTRKGRTTGTYDVLVGEKKIGTVESSEQTLYRKVGRLSNPSGRAVRWRWSLYRLSESGCGHERREGALEMLCRAARRAGVIQ